VDHVEFVKQETCDFVTVVVYLLAVWVFEAEGNVGFIDWVALNVLVTIVEDAFDCGLVPDAVVVAAVELVARFQLVPNNYGAF
jgi:hypothetical protein